MRRDARTGRAALGEFGAAGCEGPALASPSPPCSPPLPWPQAWQRPLVLQRRVLNPSGGQAAGPAHRENLYWAARASRRWSPLAVRSRLVHSACTLPPCPPALCRAAQEGCRVPGPWLRPLAAQAARLLQGELCCPGSLPAGVRHNPRQQNAVLRFGYGSLVAPCPSATRLADLPVAIYEHLQRGCWPGGGCPGVGTRLAAALNRPCRPPAAPTPCSATRSAPTTWSCPAWW